jgi:hypothetical protein
MEKKLAEPIFGRRENCPTRAAAFGNGMEILLEAGRRQKLPHPVEKGLRSEEIQGGTEDAT